MIKNIWSPDKVLSHLTIFSIISSLRIIPLRFNSSLSTYSNFAFSWFILLSNRSVSIFFVRVYGFCFSFIRFSFEEVLSTRIHKFEYCQRGELQNVAAGRLNLPTEPAVRVESAAGAQVTSPSRVSCRSSVSGDYPSPPVEPTTLVYRLDQPSAVAARAGL